MIPLRSTFLRLSVSPRSGSACRARSWVRLFLGFLWLGFLWLGFLCVLRRLCALASSLSRHQSLELEGAPPLVCKGGLLPSKATHVSRFAHRFSFSPHHPDELEGAPPLVCKGGLLRSNATNSLLFVLAEAQA